MGISCVALGCSNRQEHHPGLPFYRFPADPERREMWIKAINREDWLPTPYSRLCAMHFISGKKNNNPRSPDYVPSIFTNTTLPKKAKGKQSLDASDRGTSTKKQRIETTRHGEAAQILLSMAAAAKDYPSSSDTMLTNSPLVCSSSCATTTTPIAVQTNMTMSDIQALQTECENLRRANSKLRGMLCRLASDEKSFTDHDQVRL